LARHEGEFHRNAEQPLSLNELLALLGAGEGGGLSRDDAIARYLSGAEGWREAAKMLGGTFAEAATRLKERKAD